MPPCFRGNPQACSEKSREGIIPEAVILDIGASDLDGDRVERYLMVGIAKQWSLGLRVPWRRGNSVRIMMLFSTLSKLNFEFYIALCIKNRQETESVRYPIWPVYCIHYNDIKLEIVRVIVRVERTCVRHVSPCYFSRQKHENVRREMDSQISCEQKRSLRSGLS